MRSAIFISLMLFVGINMTAQKADSIQASINSTEADSSKSILFSRLADALSSSNAQQAIVAAKNGLTLARNINFTKGIFENYYSLGSVFQGQSSFDSALFYFYKAKQAAIAENNKIHQAQVYSSMGHSFMRKSNLDSARYYLDSGLTLAIEIKDYRTEAGIYNNYGNVLLEESKFQPALDYFIKAVKMYEHPLNDQYGQALALSNIGNIEYRLGNYDKALDYARQSMTIAKKKGLTPQIGYAHKLLGRIYRKQKKYDSALNEYKSGQKLYLVLGDVRSAAEILQNIGNIYFDKNQLRDALSNYQQSLVLSKRISNKPLIAYAYSSIGQAFMALGKNDDALVYLDSAKIAAQRLGNKYLVLSTYEAISSAYQAKGDFKKALEVHQVFTSLKDSITQSENRQLAEETQAKYELEKKEAQIALLEKDHALKDLEMGRQRASQVGIAVALVSVIIIALLLMNRYRLAQRTKRQAEIERIRNNIARDLHDDIGSTLSTINIISKLAMHDNPGGKNTHLIRIGEQSSRIMESMSDMVWSINPVNDSLEKVVVKMKVFASEILEPKNINYKFTGEASLADLSLDPDKRKNLFLIYKEAINNSAKYSEADEVQVIFSSAKNSLLLTIRDNGKGFDLAKIKEGNGLKNMEVRAGAMGAKFDLTTAEGRGTNISVALSVT